MSKVKVAVRLRPMNKRGENSKTEYVPPYVVSMREREGREKR